VEINEIGGYALYQLLSFIRCQRAGDVQSVDIGSGSNDYETD
jgi:hypothetical protein